MADLLNLFAIIIVFGLALWLVNAFIPMPGSIASLLNVLVTIILVLYILQNFGLIHHVMPTIRLFK
jgi:hypothetical protein